MNFTKIKPYDDVNMIYDRDLHQYVLTQNASVNLLGETMTGDDGVANRRLKAISRTVYRYLYNHIHSSNQPIVEQIISTTEEGRKWIQNALVCQLEADLDNHYNSLEKQLPIDFQTGKVISREEIAKNQVCIACEDSLRQFCGGVNMMCAVPYGIVLPSNRYELGEY